MPRRRSQTSLIRSTTPPEIKWASFATPVYLNPRPNTKYAGVYETTNGVSSWYDGLAVTFEKRLSHGFQSLASYTWSHAIDDGQGTSTNAVFTGSTSIWTYNGNYAFDKGSSQIDQRHRLAYSFVWSPTLMHNDNAVCQVRRQQLARFRASRRSERQADQRDDPADRHTGHRNAVHQFDQRIRRQPARTVPAGRQPVHARRRIAKTCASPK